MQQNYRRPIAHYPVNNLGIAAIDAMRNRGRSKRVWREAAMHASDLITGQPGVSRPSKRLANADRLAVRGLPCPDRRRWQQQWLFRHDDPRDEVGNEADPGHHRWNQPDQADQRHIDIKVLRKTEAHAGNLASEPRTHKSGSRQ
jgi:hypothetical protein